MLRKRDPIFWAATGLFVAALALGLTVDSGFLFLMVAAYLLRPTVHSLGLARKLIDERQLQLQYQASNVGFSALVAGNVVVILYLSARNDHTFEMVTAVLVLGLAARALAGVLMVWDPAVAGSRILVTVGLLLAVFGVIEGGLDGIVVHVLPGLLVAVMGVLAQRTPRSAGIAALVLGAGVIVWRVVTIANGRAPSNWGQVVGVVLLAAPLLTAAGCLLRGASGDDDVARTPPVRSAGAGSSA
ncbi:MAG: hypothetical protein KGO03_03165 [Gemmatimonadota bacterium]|nr:hypothetical protein [Gemmatimonadota bacterium]MDE3215372.1 hypothetical protein [Gemmatimonadota bacterium]